MLAVRMQHLWQIQKLFLCQLPLLADETKAHLAWIGNSLLYHVKLSFSPALDVDDAVPASRAHTHYLRCDFGRRTSLW